MWVVMVGAGLSGGGDSYPSLQPSETSPMPWFLVLGGGGCVPRARGCGGCVEEVVAGRGGQKSKLLSLPGLSWAEPWTVLGLSLHRKWELSDLLGAWGCAKIKGGGPVPWGVERNESQI